MIAATAIMVLGLLGGIVASQLGGLRLGGVIIVPLFAIYILRSFGTFPVLVMSVIGGYVTLAIVKRYLLVYGRPLFVIAIVASGLVPLVVWAFTVSGFGPTGVVDELGFIGSVLPGIAAWNLHRMPDDRLVVDVLWAQALLLILVVVGIGLVIFVGLTPLALVGPPILLGPDSDIATAFGLALVDTRHPVLLPFPRELAMLGLGLFVSEGVRARWGLRIGGVIVLPLLVLFAFRNGTLLLLYLVVAVVAFAGIQVFHRWTLVYGRVLLSMSVIFGLLLTLSLLPVLSFAHGLLPFLTGVLGGVSAYNAHVQAPAERGAMLAMAAGVFVLLAGLARLFITPRPTGILVDVGPLHLLGGVLLVAVAAVTALRFERLLPGGPRGVASMWEVEEWDPEEIQL